MADIRFLFSNNQFSRLQSLLLNKPRSFVLPRLRSGLSTHLCGLSLKHQGAFAAQR
jgi:hypothetical protein